METIDAPAFKVTEIGTPRLVDVAESDWFVLTHATESRPVVLELPNLRALLVFTTRDKAEQMRGRCPGIGDARVAKIRNASAFLDAVQARGDEVLVDVEDDGEGGFMCHRYASCVMAPGGDA